MRRVLRPFLVFLAASCALLSAPGCATATATTPSLGVGDELFWSSTSSGDPAAEFPLDVRAGGERLRVGFDHATDGDVWKIEVSGPGGSASFSPGLGLYSEEGVIDAPDPGRYTVRVSGEEITDKRFRMRAKLEGELRLPAERTALLPNLQALPPYEFSFLTPVTNGGGALGEVPIGVESPGGRASCHSEEVAEEQAVRCLRMAFGVRNTGMGPMQLSYRGAEFPADQELVQTIRYSDGSSEERVAGVAKYHKTHQHYHHDKAISLQLFKVGEGGALTPASAVHMKGFAHRNELLREWRRFYPLLPFEGFGLRAGWGDYYEWDRPGNYIDFGINGDGRYVLKMTADPVEGILESDESDNHAYSLIEVAGTDVKWLESGRGSDPSDPCRILVPMGNEPEPDGGFAQPPRPRSCPSDTTWAELVPPSPATAAPSGTPAASPPAKAAPKRPSAKQRRAAARRRALARRLAKCKKLRSAKKRRACRARARRAFR